MADIYLLKYNNYYDRIVKKEENLNGYNTTNYMITENPIQGVNFNYGDYINTTQVVNIPDSTIPNYLVVAENGVINSRWFIISAEKTTYNQLLLTLHRDVIVDYWDSIKDPDTKIFVEKAILGEGNNLIYNSEDMTFNQIKTKEILLKDDSNCPWLCIYAARENAGGVKQSYSVSIPDNSSNIKVNKHFNSEEEYNTWLTKYQNMYYSPTLTSFTFGANYAGTLQQNFTYIQEIPNSDFSGISYSNLNYTAVVYGGDDSTTSNNTLNKYALNNANKENFDGFDPTDATQTKALQFAQNLNNNKNDTELFSPFIENLITSNEVEEIQQYNNQIISVTTSTGLKYYSVQLSSVTNSTRSFDIPDDGKIKTDYFDPTLGQIYKEKGAQKRSKYGTITFNCKKQSLSTNIINIAAYKATISTERIISEDSPYDMFCIPYSDSLKLNINGTEITSSKYLATSIGSTLALQYGSGSNNFIYDVQILPYCPLTYTTIDITTNTLSFEGGEQYYTKITNADETKTIGFIMHSNRTSFIRSIYLKEPIIINNYKIDSSCDLYRLCSPNYNGVFEFNAAKNKGISQFNIQCTYKPFSPYIKVFPIWDGLYGKDFSTEGDYDYRGLICGGDFSIPIMTSAWNQFEIQNKNYQISFDRQVQNMEVNNSVQREREQWQVAAGTLSAAISGASTGSQLGSGGGVGGMIAGGILGGLTAGGISYAAGRRDIQLNEMLRSEALDYTKDQFGYQLGNIKALPQSLSKTTGYNIDNKYFPFLEYYTCSDEEKEALANKIAYNGMTVMTIGSLSDYINNEWSYTDKNGTIEAKKYFKGRLIRLTKFNDDFHILNTIADELYKGVFLK